MPSREDKPRALRPQDLEHIKRLLLDRRQELWDEILETLEQDAGEEHQELVRMVRDRADGALAELRESTVFAMIELKHRELEAVESALRRIEEGKYGHCEICGRFIRPARLEVMPHAVRCRRCQEQLERRENAISH